MPENSKDIVYEDGVASIEVYMTLWMSILIILCQALSPAVTERSSITGR
jgi:hypothetical protein